MIRSKTFSIITTLNPDNTPHTTGILYGVSPPFSKFSLYVLTSKNYKKVGNIQRNPMVSFIIPYPHHHLRFVPSGTITINGEAEILPFKTEKIKDIFSEKRILRMITKDLNPEETENYVFLKIKPNPRILVYAVGQNIWKLRSSHTEGGYSVKIPEERL
jgi:hypothetical protein